METENITSKQKIMNALDDIFDKIQKQEDINLWYDDLKSVIDLFINGYNFEFLERQLLNYKDTINKKEDKNYKDNENINKLNRLVKKIRDAKPNVLIDKLKSTGFALAKDTNFKKAINDQIYRILELARLDKRDDVIHILMRIFISYQKRIPEELIISIKPVTDNNLFKAYIYSFLTGFVGENENKNKED